MCLPLQRIRRLIVLEKRQQKVLWNRTYCVYWWRNQQLCFWKADICAYYGLLQGLWQSWPQPSHQTYDPMGSRAMWTTGLRVYFPTELKLELSTRKCPVTPVFSRKYLNGRFLGHACFYLSYQWYARGPQ